LRVSSSVYMAEISVDPAGSEAESREIGRKWVFEINPRKVERRRDAGRGLRTKETRRGIT